MFAIFWLLKPVCGNVFTVWIAFSQFSRLLVIVFFTKIKPHVLNCPGSAPLPSSWRQNICPCGFTTCPLGVLCSTSGAIDRCQGASKKLASFDVLSHCLYSPGNILFLASGATPDTPEYSSTAGSRWEVFPKSKKGNAIVLVSSNYYMYPHFWL